MRSETSIDSCSNSSNVFAFPSLWREPPTSSLSSDANSMIRERSADDNPIPWTSLSDANSQTDQHSAPKFSKDANLKPYQLQTARCTLLPRSPRLLLTHLAEPSNYGSLVLTFLPIGAPCLQGEQTLGGSCGNPWRIAAHWLTCNLCGAPREQRQRMSLTASGSLRERRPRVESDCQGSGCNVVGRRASQSRLRGATQPLGRGGMDWTGAAAGRQAAFLASDVRRATRCCCRPVWRWLPAMRKGRTITPLKRSDWAPPTSSTRIRRNAFRRWCESTLSLSSAPRPAPIRKSFSASTPSS